ncbi:uncharacterized protein [Sinocyclocheilus grahami]|uniref:uncharacterized protein n=1 Tax=Sinocyclocheilus grahami TaxID=75366 RepID=UPI0007AD5EB6|nr:PREDICTED: uncharacterized protein LOC107558536 [Sinocyclocheilus grahami]
MNISSIATLLHNMRVTTTCPLCQKEFFHLQQHLKKSHHLANREELRLIVLYSSGRINSKLKCPHCAKDLVRLDKHFAFFHNLSAVDRQAQLKRAKQQRVLELLATLRASHPHPPMLTSLDVQMSNKAEEEHPDVPQNVPAAPANDPAAPAAKTRSRTATSLSSGMKKYRITRQIADIAALRRRIRAMKYERAPSRFVCGVTNSTAIKHKLEHLEHFLKWILKTRSKWVRASLSYAIMMIKNIKKHVTRGSMTRQQEVGQDTKAVSSCQ